MFSRFLPSSKYSNCNGRIFFSSFIPTSIFPGSILEDARSAVRYSFQEKHNRESSSVSLLLNKEVYVKHSTLLSCSSIYGRIPESPLHRNNGEFLVSPVFALLGCYRELFNDKRFQKASRSFLHARRTNSVHKGLSLHSTKEEPRHNKRPGRTFKAAQLADFPSKYSTDERQNILYATRKMFGCRLMISCLSDSVDFKQTYTVEGNILPSVLFRNNRISGAREYTLAQGDISYLLKSVAAEIVHDMSSSNTSKCLA
ncbi:alcohol dehydrogenase [Perkinsela sp. CCAP 1560/4]|nr:alcohol dehydrogenase [Perkinsela sp. CCAP 1560/4]|eukprot:KNH04809.1 alcohol dehydrogenase [Perkinsela sp. CCAP 1560/4]